MPVADQDTEPAGVRNCSWILEMPLTMPAKPNVSSGRPHCVPFNAKPAATVRSMSV